MAAMEATGRVNVGLRVVGGRRESGSGLWEWRPSTGYIEWHPGAGAADLFPLRGTMVFDEWAKCIHPEDRPATVARLQRAALDQVDFRLRFRAIGWDGRERWVEGELEVRIEQGATCLRAELRRASGRPAEAGLDERFRVAVESMLDPFGIYKAVRDREGSIVDFRVQYVNDAACRANGMGREAQVGHLLCDLVPGHRDSPLFADYCKVVGTGIPLSRESHTHTDDRNGRRETRVFDVRASRLGDGLVAVWRDVTGQRWIERELQSANEFLQNLIRNSPAAIFAKDLDGRFIVANDLTGKSLHRSASQVLGRRAEEIDVGPGAPWTHDDSEVIARDSPVEFEEALEIDGVPRRFHVVKFPLHDRHGHITSVGGIATDMTSYHRVLERLEESEARLRLATDAASVGIWHWDLRTGQVYWSTEMHGLFAAPGTVQTIADYRRLVHPDDVDGLWAALQGAMDQRSTFRAEFRAVQPDGSLRWLSTTGRADFDGATPVRVLGAVQDITDAKSAQAAMQDAQRHKDEFITVLSHELRNFLSPIRHATAILQGGPPADERSARAVGVLRRQVDNLSRLVADMLDVSRIQAGKLEVRLEPLTAGDVVACAVDAALPSMEARRQVLVVAPGGLAAPIRGDPVRLCQALVNLVLNAVKYSPQGARIEIRVALDGAVVRIGVTDEGAGFDPSMAGRLFDLYQQVHDGAHGGLGIGLHLVRSILEMHGGGVEAHSDGPGRGASFTLWLPLDPHPPLVSA